MVTPLRDPEAGIMAVLLSIWLYRMVFDGGNESLPAMEQYIYTLLSLQYLDKSSFGSREALVRKLRCIARIIGSARLVRSSKHRAFCYKKGFGHFDRVNAKRRPRPAEVGRQIRLSGIWNLDCQMPDREARVTQSRLLRHIFLERLGIEDLKYRVVNQVIFAIP